MSTTQVSQVPKLKLLPALIDVLKGKKTVDIFGHQATLVQDPPDLYNYNYNMVREYKLSNKTNIARFFISCYGGTTGVGMFFMKPPSVKPTADNYYPNPDIYIDFNFGIDGTDWGIFNHPHYTGPQENAKYVNYLMYFFAEWMGLTNILSAYTDAQAQWLTYSNEKGFERLERSRNGPHGNYVTLFHKKITGKELPGVWRRALKKIPLFKDMCTKLTHPPCSMPSNQRMNFKNGSMEYMFTGFAGCCKYARYKIEKKGNVTEEEEIKFLKALFIPKIVMSRACVFLRHENPMLFDYIKKLGKQDLYNFHVLTDDIILGSERSIKQLKDFEGVH